MKKNITPYEKNNEFVRKAKCLLNELDELSRLNGIPYFFTAAIANTEQDTDYLTRSRSALTMGLQLSNDHIVDHMLVHNGFQAHTPEALPDIEL